MCEDAPCCGCCGTAVWAAEARAYEEWSYDRHYDDFGPNWDGYDDEEDEE